MLCLFVLMHFAPSGRGKIFNCLLEIVAVWGTLYCCLRFAIRFLADGVGHVWIVSVVVSHCAGYLFSKQRLVISQLIILLPTGSVQI